MESNDDTKDLWYNNGDYFTRSKNIRKGIMTTTGTNAKKEKKTEEIDIDFLLSDIMHMKAECLKDRKLFKYAEYLEKQLLKIKNREAVLRLGAQLK